MSLFIFFASSAQCSGFFGFPVWYEYIHPANSCQPQINSLSDIWLIAAAIIEIALRAAALVAVIFIIYGGFGYTTSQGDPDGTAKAKSTLVNALIGLAVAVTAAAIVSFIARKVQ